MGHVNQLYFLAQHVRRDAAIKIVEIGSKDYGSTVPWREAFTQAEYVGVDAESGRGVDVVCDITQSADGIPTDANLIICCSVLEHVRRPWVAADRITSLMQPGAMLYVSVPWIQRYHPYPDDYWRFSHAGIRELFPLLTWESQAYSTIKEGDFWPAEQGVDNLHARDYDGRKLLPHMEIHSLGVR